MIRNLPNYSSTHLDQVASRNFPHRWSPESVECKTLGRQPIVATNTRGREFTGEFHPKMTPHSGRVLNLDGFLFLLS